MKEQRRIITFSRRSDPAPFTAWLMKRIDEGFCDVPNPFSGKPYRVSLRPDDVALFTFWTKNPQPLLSPVREMTSRGFRVALFVTVTGYPRHIEANVPTPSETADALSQLAEHLGAGALWWRYDPVILSGKIDVGWHRENFETLCRGVWSGKTRRVIFSLAHIDGQYHSIRARLEQALESAGDTLEMPPFNTHGYDDLYERAVSLFASLSDTAKRCGITAAEVCCSPKLRPGETRIRQGRCLDASLLRELVPGLGDIPYAPTRSGVSMSGRGYADCGCVKSTDIGINGTCPHGCVYCYANRRGMNGEAVRMLSLA